MSKFAAIAINKYAIEKEARVRFGVGTKFNNHNLKPGVKASSILTAQSQLKWEGNELLVRAVSGGNYTIWMRGNWADVLSSPPSEEYPIFN